MTECIPQLRLCFHPDLPVVVEFDAPEISSDGGALLLRQVDERLGLSAGFSAFLSEGRERQRVQHSRQEQSRQRIFQNKFHPIIEKVRRRALTERPGSLGLEDRQA
jgi:Transposase DDE domain group 1